MFTLFRRIWEKRIASGFFTKYLLNAELQNDCLYPSLQIALVQTELYAIRNWGRMNKLDLDPCSMFKDRKLETNIDNNKWLFQELFDRLNALGDI